MSHKVQAGSLSIVAILAFDPENSADVNRVKNLDQEERQDLMRELDILSKYFEGPTIEAADLNEKGVCALVISDARSLEEWSLLTTIGRIVGNIFRRRISSSSIIEKLANVQSALKEHRFADKEFNKLITTVKNTKNVSALPKYRRFVAMAVKARINILTDQQIFLKHKMNQQNTLKEKLLNLKEELAKISKYGCRREDVQEIKEIIRLIAREKIRNPLLRKKMRIVESALESLKFNLDGKAVSVRKRINRSNRRKVVSIPVTGILNFVNSSFIIDSIEDARSNYDREVTSSNGQLKKIITEIHTLQEHLPKFDNESSEDRESLKAIADRIVQN